MVERNLIVVIGHGGGMQEAAGFLRKSFAEDGCGRKILRAHRL
jgi:hypothetical protein